VGIRLQCTVYFGPLVNQDAFFNQFGIVTKTDDTGSFTFTGVVSGLDCDLQIVSSNPVDPEPPSPKHLKALKPGTLNLGNLAP
jgi:hypothetical protein